MTRKAAGPPPLSSAGDDGGARLRVKEMKRAFERQPDAVSRPAAQTLAEHASHFLSSQPGDHLRFITRRLDDHDLGWHGSWTAKGYVLWPNAHDDLRARGGARRCRRKGNL